MNNTKKNSKGSILFISISMIFVSLSLGAVTVDLANLYLIKSELQNAADSAALTGGSYLFPSTATGPNWTVATNQAHAAVLDNTVAGEPLTNGSVQTGYHDLTGAVSGLKTITPPTVAGANDVPAVKVTISKSDGNNGGAVKLFFGPFIGIETFDLSASSTSIAGSPGTAFPNSLFPVAMAASLYNNYWDSATGNPKIDPATGQPYSFKIDAAGGHGNWTSFTSDSNDASTLQDFMANGNPLSIALNDLVWIQPGAKATLYDYVPVGKDVLVPIVDITTTKTAQHVLGFGAIHIDAAQGGSVKAITVHFIKDYKAINTSPGGGNYGAYVPPKLIN